MPKFHFSNLKEMVTDPKKRVRLILIAGAFLLTVPLILAIGMAGASNPTFCGGVCHDQQPEYQTWRDSSHSQVPCYSCHMPADDIIGFFIDKAKSGITAATQEFITGVEYPQNKDSETAFEIPKEVCQRCHNLATRYITPRPIFSRKMEGRDSKTEKKYHTKHLEKGLTCTICHNRVVHKEPTLEEAKKDSRKMEIFNLFQEYKGKDEETGKKIAHRYKDFLDMKEGCLRCHSSQREGTPEWEELVKRFPEIKEANPPTACTTCHDANWSGLPVGHGENWRAEHGPIARKNFAYCMGCHDAGKKFAKSETEKFCVNCHAPAQAATFK